ncbi:hypothetical protein [Bacillus velezensis]|uniref:hypothetical protein n=1 Tax=Bacillus velezensis TaxID=492670 RepID=UPI00245288CB|nr:hypothetical protein [Bacillus velezensis]MDH3102745.1 hypothetical protein [Bacillus velezensis]
MLVYEYGRTKQEALSNLCRKMIREYPDETFTTDFAKVSDYGNEGSDKRYVVGGGNKKIILQMQSVPQLIKILIKTFQNKNKIVIDHAFLMM